MSTYIDYDTQGRASERELLTLQCPKDQHEETYSDEYGSWISCSHCKSSSGKYFRWKIVRRPLLDVSALQARIEELESKHIPSCTNCYARVELYGDYCAACLIYINGRL